MELRYGDVARIPDVAAELEGLGYSALWVPDVGGELFPSLDLLLGATRTITVATGILNVWKHTPDEVAAWWHELPAGHRDRVLLGLGISHGVVIGERYGKPLATMRAYLDGLEATGVPLERTCLAALGPKMLDLAATRTAGAHPYLVTPAHTARARAAVGDGLLAVEQTVALDADRDSALGRARKMVAGYGTLPNYANSWKRIGFSDEEVGEVADTLVEALVACGGEPVVQARVRAQRDAGADHVCVQVLARPSEDFPLDAWRALAPG